MGKPLARSASTLADPRADSGARNPPARALRGLDWLNFFLADVQTGVGPFLAIYLAGYAWNEQRVGLALTVGGVAGILAQTPAGALVDVQTGVGPFLAIYLAGYAWNEQRVGLALTVGGVAGILAQTPAGALVD